MRGSVRVRCGCHDGRVFTAVDRDEATATERREKDGEEAVLTQELAGEVSELEDDGGDGEEAEAAVVTAASAQRHHPDDELQQLQFRGEEEGAMEDPSRRSDGGVADLVFSGEKLQWLSGLWFFGNFLGEVETGRRERRWYRGERLGFAG